MTVSFDDSGQLLDLVNQALASNTPLRIHGGGSKAFLGREVQGTPLDTRAHRGIVTYDPTELVISVRAGTPLAELEAQIKALRDTSAKDEVVDISSEVSKLEAKAANQRAQIYRNLSPWQKT